MEKTLKEHLTQAGKAKTAAKKTASRKNGTKGGRPSPKKIEAELAELGITVAAARATEWNGSRDACFRDGLDPRRAWAASVLANGCWHEPVRAYATLSELRESLIK